MKRYFALFLFFASFGFAQAIRVDPITCSTIPGSVTPGTLPPILALPGCTVTVSEQTYTDATMTTACPTNKPLVMHGTSTCVATADAEGNFGFWIASPSWTYTIIWRGTSFGPYPQTGWVANSITPSSTGAVGDGTHLLGCSLAAGPAVLNCPGATFKATDVGKLLVVQGETHAGAYVADLVTTISAFVDATHVTPAAISGSPFTAVSAYYGTDNSTQLQDAIDAAIALGGKVEMPNGKIFMYSTSLDASIPAGATGAYQGVEVSGNGPGSGLFYTGSSDGIQIKGSTLTFPKRLKFARFSLYGTSAASTAIHAISGVNYVNDGIQISGVIIDRFYGASALGIRCDATCYNMLIDQNTSVFGTLVPVYIGYASNPFAIRDSWFRGWTYCGIQIVGDAVNGVVQGGEISGNNIDEPLTTSAVAGIFLTYARGIVLVNNQFENRPAAPISQFTGVVLDNTYSVTGITNYFNVNVNTWEIRSSAEATMILNSRYGGGITGTFSDAGSGTWRMELTEDQSTTVSRLSGNTKIDNGGLTASAGNGLNVWGNNNKTVTGATACSGCPVGTTGQVKLTVASHGLTTGDQVRVYGVTGVTGATGIFPVTVIDANTIRLQGSTFGGTYVSPFGGTVMKRSSVLLAEGAAASDHFNGFELNNDLFGIYDFQQKSAAAGAGVIQLNFEGSSTAYGYLKAEEATGYITAQSTNGFNAPGGLKSTLGNGLQVVGTGMSLGTAQAPAGFTAGDSFRFNNSVDQNFDFQTLNTATPITAVVDDGFGAIKVTSGLSPAVAGQTVTVAGVTGTTEANGSWVISVPDPFAHPHEYVLNGSTFTNAYTGGGTIDSGKASIYLSFYGSGGRFASIQANEIGETQIQGFTGAALKDASGTSLVRATASGVEAIGGSASTVVCWKADGKTLGYATVAEITAGTCH